MNILHKHFKTITMIATQPLSDQSWTLLGNYGLRLLRVIFLLSLWRMLLPKSGDISGMTLQAVLTYTLISEVFADQLSNRSGLDEALWRGDIANRFLRPMGIYGQFAAEMIGKGVPNLLFFSIPLLLITPILGVNPFPATPMAGCHFMISLALSMIIGVAFDFLFAGLMVFLEHSVYALQQIRDAISVLLSGALIPLALLPYGLGDLFSYLPFASLASAPLRLYTGTGDPSFLITLQIIWAIILWIIAHALWQYNRERLVSHGG